MLSDRRIQRVSVDGIHWYVKMDGAVYTYLTIQRHEKEVGRWGQSSYSGAYAESQFKGENDVMRSFSKVSEYLKWLVMKHAHL